MARRVSVRNLQVGDVVEAAYDRNDNLLDREITIESPEDLRRLREQSVAYCSVRETSPDDGEERDPDRTDDEPVPAEDVLGDQLEDLPNLIEKTEAVYSATVDRLGDVFEDLEDSGSSAVIDDLEPHVDELLSFVDESPASVSVLTQIEDYGRTTFNHCVNVSILCLVYGHHQGLDRDELRRLGFGGLVHDIGKTKLSREVVQKDRELTDEEWEIVKRHPTEGERILSEHGFGESIRNIAHQHHERPDGSGYPRGIEEIDPLAKVVSVFDVYEALTAPRPYKEAQNPLRAYRELKDHFYEFPETRRILKGLVRGIGFFPVGCAVKLTNGDLAMVRKNRPEHLEHPVVIVLERGDETTVEEPYEVDLRHVANQKQMIDGRVYDEDVTVETVLELSKVPTLRREIADVFKNQGF